MKNKAGKTIAAIFLSGVLALGAVPEISAEALSSKDCYIYVAFDGVSVRKGPGTEYDKIGTIKRKGKLTYKQGNPPQLIFRTTGLNIDALAWLEKNLPALASCEIK